MDTRCGYFISYRIIIACLTVTCLLGRFLLKINAKFFSILLKNSLDL